jgi:hypothetical protein
MAANIAEGTQSTLPVADNHDGLAGDIGSEKSFRIRDGTLDAVPFPA